MIPPPIEKGCCASFWCETEDERGKRTNRLLVFMNEYEMELSDECDNAPEEHVRYDEKTGEWFWTGWFEPACEHCETYWTFHEKVLRWKELPKFEDEIAERNRIGSIFVEDCGGAGDNLAIVLASYFEEHNDKPADTEIDSETGWSQWAIEKTNRALALIAKGGV